MPKFVELTEKGINKPVWVNPDLVTKVRPYGGSAGSRLNFTGEPQELTVAEVIEEVLARFKGL